MTVDANASARDRAPADDEAALRQLLSASGPGERRDAALALVDAADSGLAEATVHALVARARRDDVAEVRQFAVEALGVAGEGREGIRAALDDDEPWVRAEAVVAFSRVAEDGADVLRRCLDDEGGWVRRNALIALGKAGAVDPDTLRERLADDPHGPVREYAATYLAESPGDVEESVRVLAAVLARDPDAFVRAKAAESLGEIGTPRAVEAIEAQGLRDRSDDVRRTAKLALATARGTDPERLDVERPERGGRESAGRPKGGRASSRAPTGPPGGRRRGGEGGEPR